MLDPVIPESLVLQSATASPSVLAANIVIAVAVILVLVIRSDINAAVSLVIGSLYMGIASELGLVGTTDAIGTGFGNLMGEIGIPLIFGIMIGTFLAECGGARKIATTLVESCRRHTCPTPSVSRTRSWRSRCSSTWRSSCLPRW